MSDSFFKIKKGANLEPKTGTTVTVEGDVAYNDTSKKMEIHDGISADSVVQEAKSATLTNKVLTGNTAANLVSGSGTLTLNTSGTVTVPNATDTLVGQSTSDTLSNKTIDTASTNTIKINGNTLSATAGTATVTIPNTTDTLVNLTGSQVLTNKTLSGNTAATLISGSGTLTLNTTGNATVPNVTDTLVSRTSTDTGANRLQNKDLSANNVNVVDNTDTSKKIAFTASGSSATTTTTIAAASTVSRTLTLPDATDTITANAATQTLSNKTMGDALSFTQVATPASPSAGFNKLYTKSDDKLYVLTSGGVETAVGSGSAGGINYIANPDAESSTTGWAELNCTQTVTITIASPAVFTVASTTGMYVGMPIAFKTTGALPTGLTAGTTYYISSVVSSTTFKVSATLGGSDVNTSGTQSGTHTSLPLVPINNTTVALSGLTFSRSTSSPLRGSASFSLAQTNSTIVAGQGVNYNFTTNTADEAKVLNVSFDYNASSTFVASSGSVGSESDIEVFIWDATNGALIPVTPRVITANGSNNYSFAGSFQTASNSTSYSLIIFCSSTNANATGWTFKFDNVSVGPNSIGSADRVVAAKVYATANTTLSTGTSTAIALAAIQKDTHGAWSTSSNKYTIPVSGWYRVSASIIYAPNSTGQRLLIIRKNGTTALLSVLLPAAALDGSNSNQCQGSTVDYYIAGDYIELIGNQTSGGNLTTDISGGDGTANQFLAIERVSGASAVEATDGRVVAARAYGASQADSTNDTIYQFNTVEFDTHSAITTGAAWKFTAPISGKYEIECNMIWNAAASASIGKVHAPTLWKNGSSQYILLSAYAQTTTSTGKSASGSTVISLNAGDYIDLRTNTDDSTAHTANGGSSTYISIKRLSGPATIAASESVNAGYSSPNNTITAGNDVTLVYATKIFDTHNAYNTSTGIYTVPVSGKYRVSAFADAGRINFSANTDYVVMFASKNSATVSGAVELGVFAAQTSGTNCVVTMNGSILLSCVAGDTIKIVGSSHTASVSLPVTGGNFYIERIGN